MVSEEVDCLCSGIRLMDEAVHGKASHILLTTWDPPDQKDSGPVGYAQDEASMSPIPAEHLPPSSIPETGDLFIVFVPRAERQFRQRRTAEPKAPVASIALRFAAHHVWEKVQWKQERKKAPPVDPFQLLISAEEMIACSDSKSKVALSQLKEMMDKEFEFFWKNHAAHFIRTYGNELFGRWRCKRNVEAMAVAWVAVNIPKVQDILSFLKELRQVADAKTLLPS